MNHQDYQLAAASIIGRDHRNINVHKNNQDGLSVIRSSSCTVAVIADGCGSSAHSEVGAKIGARVAAESISRLMAEHGSVDWRQVLRETLSCISQLSIQMGGSFRQIVQDYFLFTMVGVLLEPKTATFFALGDGVVVVNGEVTVLGPFPNNQPPYAGYKLLDQPLVPGSSETGNDQGIQLIGSYEIEQLEHFLIGSDGVNDLINVQSQDLPGMNELVGPLDQFWQEKYFDPTKPDLLARRLRLIGRDWPKKDPEAGLLPDDTTMIVGRRMSS